MKLHASFKIVASVLAAILFSASASGQVLNESQKLLPSDGEAGEEFGGSLSVSGDIALVGARWDDDNGAGSGSVYAFRLDGTTWVQEQKLLASDGGGSDFFGFSASVFGDVGIVGARQLAFGDSGAAYVFRRSGETWAQETILTAFDGAAGDQFGWSVSISDDVAIVGALADDSNTGSAYVYRLVSGVWTFEEKLTASDGVNEDRFGISVAIDGNAAVVGASYARQPSLLQDGSAYIFRHSAGAWSEEQKLNAPDGVSLGQFGASVSISGDVVVIGAYNDDDNGTHSGSAYVFRNSGGNWSLEQKLTASDGAAEDRFGKSVAIDAGVVLAGATGADGAVSDSGLGYVFRWDGASWLEERKLVASDGAANDVFGGAISLSGNVAVVGAHADDDNGDISGSAYVFNLGPGEGIPAASAWGLTAMTLLLLAVGAIVLRRRAAPA